LQSLIDDELKNEIDVFLLMIQVTGESLNMDPSFKEAMEGRDKENWLKAIDGEYSNMINQRYLN